MTRIRFEGSSLSPKSAGTPTETLSRSIHKEPTEVCAPGKELSRKGFDDCLFVGWEHQSPEGANQDDCVEGWSVVP